MPLSTEVKEARNALLRSQRRVAANHLDEVAQEMIRQGWEPVPWVERGSRAIGRPTEWRRVNKIACETCRDTGYIKAYLGELLPCMGCNR